MSNPSRAKGTAWEVELLDRLRDTFGPDVHRAPLRGTHDAGDYVGTPVVVEAKSTKVPKFLEWARTCVKACAHHSSGLPFWVIAWHGDRRKNEGPFVMMSLDYWLTLERAARG
jgi:hypothetical protein